MAIRNFIYLDSEKLRSLSSQLFEGLTERVVQSTIHDDREETRQKGPMNSGRILADIFSRQTGTAETKFLDDHAYTLFEEKLISEKLIDVVENSAVKKPKRSFIKIEGKIRLNDLRASAYMLRNFNSLGLALWRTQNQPMVHSDKPIVPDKDAKKSASQQGLQLNEKVAEAAAEIMDFGYGDLLEVFLDAGEFKVSAPVRREFLRESEAMLVHKYSRVPDGRFSLVGLVTRAGWDQAQSAALPDVIDADNPKIAMRHLSLHMNELEKVYTSIGDDELVIDPIAIYREI